jgi:hypothetical protein
VLNLLTTVLDFQMKVEVVDRSLEYFSETRAIRSHRKLREIVDSFPNTKTGNQALANYLWNNNHWSRAQFLRTLLDSVEARGIRGQASLKRWAKNADFDTDVKGQFKTNLHSIGFALFHWLQLRLGIDTVKPDVHILNFVSSAIRRRVRPDETVAALRQIAKTLKLKAHRLDAAIWHYQRD